MAFLGAMFPTEGVEIGALCQSFSEHLKYSTAPLIITIKVERGHLIRPRVVLCGLGLCPKIRSSRKYGDDDEIFSHNFSY